VDLAVVELRGAVVWAATVAAVVATNAAATANAVARCMLMSPSRKQGALHYAQS